MTGKNEKEDKKDWYCDGCKRTHTPKTERIQAGDKAYCPSAWRKLRAIFKPLKRK